MYSEDPREVEPPEVLEGQGVTRVVIGLREGAQGTEGETSMDQGETTGRVIMS